MFNLLKSTPKQKEQQFIKSLEKEFARFLRPAPQKTSPNKNVEPWMSNSFSGTNTRQSYGLMDDSNLTQKGISRSVISNASRQQTSSIPNNAEQSQVENVSNINNTSSASVTNNSQQEGRTAISPTPPVSIGISELEQIINELSDMVITTYTMDSEGNSTNKTECYLQNGTVDPNCPDSNQQNTGSKSDTNEWLTKELEQILNSNENDQSTKIDEFADTIKNKLSGDNQKTETTLTNILTTLNGKKKTPGNQTTDDNQSAKIDILVKIITAVLNKLLSEKQNN
jgi:hypothetical protein